MWYSRAFRRHLCDMHIDDWNDKFLSKFSPEDYLSNLKDAKIQSAMIYLQSHVGHCYYPTNSGHMHNALLNNNEDMIKKLVDLCRDNDIFVTGYYSLIYNTYEHDKHPKWRLLESDGRSRREKKKLVCEDGFSNAAEARYGLCCPNNMEYRDFVFTQIDEILEYFDLDGMFYDMPFWPHFCYCENCQKRWAEEVGGSLPTVEDMSDPLWQKHVEKRRQWMGEFIQAVTDKTKAVNPNLSVEHNFAFGIAANDQTPCCSYEVNNACDYVGGDLYGGFLEQSFTCKFYRNITNNQPFEYMFGRCTPSLSMHTVTKSPDQIDLSVFLTAAHHGATLAIDAINLDGTMDNRFYKRLGESFKKQIPYEKYFKGDLVADVGVYYSINSIFNLHGNKFNNKTCAVNSVKAMIENHIPVDVTGCFSELDKYKAIIAPYLTYADEADNDRLISYAENGGTLYLSGAENKPLFDTLIGAEISGYTDYGIVYAAPKSDVDFGWFNEDYPLPFTANAPIIDAPKDSEILATFTYPATKEFEMKYASIHSHPPYIKTDIPAIIKKKFGKGTVIWSALPLENSENYEYKQILLSLLGIKKPAFICDAEETTEIIEFKNGNKIYVSAVELTDCYNIPKTKGFNLKVLCDKPLEITCIDNDKKVDFTYNNGYAEFSTDEFKIFTMYKIKF